MRKTFALIACLATALLIAAPTRAMGPVDGSLTMFYWDSQFEVSGNVAMNEDSAGDTGLDGELWFVEKYGLAAAYYRTDLGNVPGIDNDPEDLNLDFKWKFFSPTDMNFLAVGVGWQQADRSLTAGVGDTSGPRLVGEAGVGFKQVHGYGRYAYMPAMDDIDVNGGNNLEDVQGNEFEVGVQWRAAPYLHFRLAYHNIEFDVTEQGTGADISTSSDGLILGMGVHF